MKEPLRKVLGKPCLLSYPKLATLLTRIEAFINSRLLTTVSDLRDLTAITPTHLAPFSLPDIADEVSVNEATTRRR